MLFNFNGSWVPVTNTKLTFLQQIFSVVNSSDKRHKVITFLGIKMKLRRNEGRKVLC